ncbi:MAG: type II toxin-antitoxin system VapC family toxin [Acidobacteriota bacterium]
MALIRVLLDTSAYSSFMRGHPELKVALQRAEEIFITPIVLGELHAGFLHGSRLKKNRRELEMFLSSPRVGVLSIDDETATRYALIVESLREAGTPIPTNDIWIAASAMQYGLPILSTDAHYRHVRQVLVEDYGTR